MYHPHPYDDSVEAKVRQDELLQEAETYRLIKTLERSNRGLNIGVASMLSDIVRALGSKIGRLADTAVTRTAILDQ